MASVVSVERGKRQAEYAQLRVRIFEHYRTLALVGAEPGPREHKLPPKLGHWTPRHSDLVRGVDTRLHAVVRRIETLLTERDPARIKAQHTYLRRGDNFRRKSGKPRVQLNPGYWPPRYK